MNRWEEQLKNHPIHETLNWLKTSISEEFDDLNGDEVSEKRRFIKLIRLCEETLKSIDPEITPFNQLDSLNSSLRDQNMANQINAYVESGNPENIAEASNRITNQITQLCLLLSIANSGSSPEPIRELEKIVDSTSKILIDKKESLSQDLEKLSSSVTEKKQRLNELSTEIDQKKSEINSLISEWQNQFSSAQDSRSQEFSKWRDVFTSEKSKEIASIIERHDEKLNEHTLEFTGSINSIISDGFEKHKSILELYELTAGDSVAAGYLKNADIEKKQADNWRFISVGFIVSAVIWMFFAYNSNSSNQTEASVATAYLQTANASITNSSAETEAQEAKTNKQLISKFAEAYAEGQKEVPWYKLFITFSLSGVLLWGSAYAAQQSTKHRNNEKRTRWFALEVKAIDPFISSLDTKEKNELKKQLSERMFGQFLNHKDDGAKVMDEHAFKTVADTLGSILSKIPK